MFAPSESFKYLKCKRQRSQKALRCRAKGQPVIRISQNVLCPASVAIAVGHFVSSSRVVSFVHLRVCLCDSARRSKFCNRSLHIVFSFVSDHRTSTTSIAALFPLSFMDLFFIFITFNRPKITCVRHRRMQLRQRVHNPSSFFDAVTSRARRNSTVAWLKPPRTCDCREVRVKLSKRTGVRLCADAVGYQKSFS